MISISSVLSSPQASSPSCPGLSVETPHRYPPCFSKRPSSGTFLGAGTKPNNRGKKTSNYTQNYYHRINFQMSKL